MTEQDRKITRIIAEERSRLSNFIRRRVADPADAEDILQEVFFELVEANRLLMPIEHVTSWLFTVARNRITDLFRKKKPERFSDAAFEDQEGDAPSFENLLPSPDAGPEAIYARRALLEELVQALAELPAEQREVFIAHERGPCVSRNIRVYGREPEHPAGPKALRRAVSAAAIATDL